MDFPVNLIWLIALVLNYIMPNKNHRPWAVVVLSSELREASEKGRLRGFAARPSRMLSMFLLWHKRKVTDCSQSARIKTTKVNKRNSTEVIAWHFTPRASSQALPHPQNAELKNSEYVIQAKRDILVPGHTCHKKITSGEGTGQPGN